MLCYVKRGNSVMFDFFILLHNDFFPLNVIEAIEYSGN